MSAISRSAVAVLSFALFFTVACGGGGSNSSGSSGFPPVFVVPTPGSASEGAPFTYTLQATDPQGSNVTFALVSGPAGATISGATISWTPTHAQSRQPNQFTVRATSPSGGTATTSFTVTPAGTIHGTNITTIWGANGGVDSPADMTGALVQALVPDGANDTTIITGQGFSDGTFTIPNVPAGNYWLQVVPSSSRTLILNSPAIYGTDANNIDVGTDAVQGSTVLMSSGISSGGSSSSSSSGVSFGYLTVPVNLDVSGLDPWQPPTNVFSSTSGDGGLMGVSGLGLNVIGFPDIDITTGATSFTGQVPATLLSPMDPNNGDSTYLVQYIQTSVGVGALVKALGPLSLAINSGTTSLDISGTFTNPNPGSLTMEVKAAGFSQSVTGVNPNAHPLQFSATALYEPARKFSSTFAASQLVGTSTLIFDPLTTSQGTVLAYFTAGLNSLDVHLGTQAFSNPFSSTAAPVYLAQQSAFVPLTQQSGFTLGVTGATGYYSTTPPSADKPFDAPMLNVQNPRLNGTSLFTATSWSLPLNLSWSAPIGLAPAGYVVTLRGYGPLQCSSTLGETFCYQTLVQSVQLTTPVTSITVPTSLIRPGLDYLFQIRAIADSGTDFRTAPNRGSWNRAYSDVISAIIPSSSAGSQASESTRALGAAAEFYVMGSDGVAHKICAKDESGSNCVQ